MAHLLKDYEEKLSTSFDEIFQFRQRLFSDLSSSDEKLPSIDSIVLNKEKEIRIEQLKFLMKTLNNPKKITKMFRASDYEFKAEEFHKKCDNINDTVVLLKT